MTITQILRQIGTVVLLPVYGVAGILIADVFSRLLDVWDYYLYALFIPVIGLVCTWMVAPFYRIYNLLFVCSVGILLAYFFAYTSYYPETHPLAYASTHIPFAITVILGIAITWALIFVERQNRKP